MFPLNASCLSSLPFFPICFSLDISIHLSFSSWTQNSAVSKTLLLWLLDFRSSPVLEFPFRSFYRFYFYDQFIFSHLFSPSFPLFSWTYISELFSNPYLLIPRAQSPDSVLAFFLLGFRSCCGFPRTLNYCLIAHWALCMNTIWGRHIHVFHQKTFTVTLTGREDRRWPPRSSDLSRGSPLPLERSPLGSSKVSLWAPGSLPPRGSRSFQHWLSPGRSALISEVLRPSFSFPLWTASELQTVWLATCSNASSLWISLPNLLDPFSPELLLCSDQASNKVQNRKGPQETHGWRSSSYLSEGLPSLEF